MNGINIIDIIYGIIHIISITRNLSSYSLYTNGDLMHSNFVISFWFTSLNKSFKADLESINYLPFKLTRSNAKRQDTFPKDEDDDFSM